MNGSLYLRYLMRELRGSAGRLVFFVLCLAVGVAAVIAVAGLSDGMERGLRSKARELLAADLAVESRRPLPAELDTILADLGPATERVDLKEFVSVVAADGGSQPGKSRLAELKVVAPPYPFYGELELEPARVLHDLLDARSVVVAQSMLEPMGLAIGDALRVGGESFTIAGAVLSEPDKVNISFTSVAPRVFLSQAGVDRTGLEATGSRIKYRALVRLPGTDADGVRAAARQVRLQLPDVEYMKVETYAEAQPGLRRGLERAERFLSLVALLSLLVGGLGVGQTVRAWLQSRMDSIAILKCLGLRPREILALYLGQTVLLGLAGSIIGAVVAVGLQSLAPAFLTRIFPTYVIEVWQPFALLRGVLLGVGVALLFSLPPLLTVRRVPPAFVFRRDAAPLPVSAALRYGVGAVLLVGLFVTALLQSGSWLLAAQFTGGLLASGVVLALGAWLTARLVAGAPRRFSKVWLRHGLAALARPGAGTLGAIVALGLGVVVVLTMYLIETRLGGQLNADLPEDAPTAFMVDIQPSQWDGVEGLLQDNGAQDITSVPMVNSRLVSVDGVGVETLVEQIPKDEPRNRWVLTREQRLTYQADLPESNELLRGNWFGGDSRPEVSVEREFAEDMGADVGSVLVFDVQGVPITLHVTSIREVDWESFAVNFFLLVEPGVLEEAPQFLVATARFPDGNEQKMQDVLAADFPNVTVIQVRQVLDRIVEVLGQAGLGVQLLGAFTVIAGILILGGVVSAGTIRRGREVALLKAIGMTRSGVVSVYTVEYGLIGLVAGAIGALGGTLLSWAILVYWMNVPWTWATPAPWIAVVGTVVLAVAAGIGASLRALGRRPVEVLRES